MKQQAQVGRALGKVLQAYDDMMNDPMNEYAGYTPDPTPGLERVANKEGWTLSDLMAAVIERTGDRWAYFHTCGLSAGQEAL